MTTVTNPPIGGGHSRKPAVFVLPTLLNSHIHVAEKAEATANKVAETATKNVTSASPNTENGKPLKLLSIRNKTKEATTGSRPRTSSPMPPKTPFSLPVAALDRQLSTPSPKVSKTEESAKAQSVLNNKKDSKKTAQDQRNEKALHTLFKISKLHIVESVYDFAKALDLCIVPPRNVSNYITNQFAEHRQLILKKLSVISQKELKRTNLLTDNDLIHDYSAQFDRLAAFHPQFTLLRQLRDIWLAQQREKELLGAFIGQAAGIWVKHSSKHTSITPAAKTKIINRCFAWAGLWNSKLHKEYDQQAAKFAFNSDMLLWFNHRVTLLKPSSSPLDNLSIAMYLDQKTPEK